MKARYRDVHLVNGPIRTVDLAGGKLRIGGKGAALAQTLATDPQPVRIVLVIGSTRSCVEFGGTTTFKAGKLFTSHGAPAPTACAE